MLGTVALPACGRSQGEGRAPPRPVKVEAAQAIDGPPRLRYSAAIQADLEVPVAFKVGGYVGHDSPAPRRRRPARGRCRPATPYAPAKRWRACATPTTASACIRPQGAIGELEARNEKARLDLERARTLFAARA